MDKITHQVRAEHWAKIMNECINSGMSKTAWCRANGISEKQFFYWQRILRREAFENSQNSSLPATVGPDEEKRNHCACSRIDHEGRLETGSVPKHPAESDRETERIHSVYERDPERRI